MTDPRLPAAPNRAVENGAHPDAKLLDKGLVLAFEHPPDEIPRRSRQSRMPFRFESRLSKRCFQ